MAARAGGIGWPKCSPGMARFTAYIRVRAVQDEAGTEVIESLLAPGVTTQQETGCDCRDQERYASVHCNDLTSLKEVAVWQRPQSYPNSPS